MTKTQQALKNYSYNYQQQVKAAWRKGNDDGDGYPVGSLGSRGQTPAQAAAEEGYAILSNDGYDNPVVCADGKRVIAIADANGPWAVDITDLI